jgi:hypothetical protein
MSLRGRVTFVALWVISILVVGVLASAQAQREARRRPGSSFRSADRSVEGSAFRRTSPEPRAPAGSR